MIYPKITVSTFQCFLDDLSRVHYVLILNNVPSLFGSKRVAQVKINQKSLKAFETINDLSLNGVFGRSFFYNRCTHFSSWPRLTCQFPICTTMFLNSG